MNKNNMYILNRTNKKIQKQEKNSFIMPLISCFFAVFVLFNHPMDVFSQEATGDTNSAVPSNDHQLSNSLNEDGVKLVKKRDFIGAEKLFLRALAADKGNLTAVFNLSGVYLQNKNDGGAISLLKQYATKEQKDAGIFARLGDAYFVQKDIKEARTSYEKALSLNPNYPGVSTRLGTIYSMQGEMANAEIMLNKAADLDPNNPTTLSNLGSVLYALKKYDLAIKSLKRSTSINPTKEAYITLGNIYLAKSNEKEALVSFKRAKELGDDSKGLNEIINELSE